MVTPVYIKMDSRCTLFLESRLSESGDLIDEDGLLEFSEVGRSGLTITNTSDHTRQVKTGTVMGCACQVTVEVLHGDGCPVSATKRVSTEEADVRRQRLADMLRESQLKVLESALTNLHEAFCLHERERGETELVQFHIDQGIHKLNTTAYHLQCNGIVERFNHTLKGMLRAHAAWFGSQWDIMLPGMLFAYRNTPHESTGEKPSFLTFGVDHRTPPDAARMPNGPLLPTTLSDYWEQLMSSLSSA